MAVLNKTTEVLKSLSVFINLIVCFMYMLCSIYMDVIDTDIEIDPACCCGAHFFRKSPDEERLFPVCLSINSPNLASIHSLKRTIRLDHLSLCNNDSTNLIHRNVC